MDGKRISGRGHSASPPEQRPIDAAMLAPSVALDPFRRLPEGGLAEGGVVI